MTIREELQRIAESNSCSERDERLVEKVLHRLGYPLAVVTYGIVYLEGQGKPDSIQQTCKALLEVEKKHETQPISA
jgi:hypothetical protein